MSALRRPTTSARQREGTVSANMELNEMAFIRFEAAHGG